MISKEEKTLVVKEKCPILRETLAKTSQFILHIPLFQNILNIFILFWELKLAFISRTPPPSLTEAYAN